nr:reverse transcriptase domain-containing protein [Tanacetum cinerariifolium]
MSTPKFADVHNLIAFLSKPTESKGFEQIIDFLNANPIKYALTVNPIVYTSCIEQFWATAKAKNINGEAQIHAKVDGKKVIISEEIIRIYIKFEDEGGIDCLSNEVIFEQLTLIGGTAYQGPTIPTTSSSLPLVVERKTEATKDTVHPTNNRSTKDVQPPVVLAESPILNYGPVIAPIIEPVVSPVSAL